jgi:hypothetical protein
MIRRPPSKQVTTVNNIATIRCFLIIIDSVSFPAATVATALLIFDGVTELATPPPTAWPPYSVMNCVELSPILSAAVFCIL